MFSKGFQNVYRKSLLGNVFEMFLRTCFGKVLKQNWKTFYENRLLKKFQDVFKTFEKVRNDFGKWFRKVFKTCLRNDFKRFRKSF